MDDPAENNGSGGGSGSGVAAGGDGAGDAGAGAGAGSKDGAGAGGDGAGPGAAGGDEAAKAAAAAEKQELETLRRFKTEASQHVDIDAETGAVKPRAVAAKPDIIVPTQGELERAQLVQDAAERSVQLVDQSRKAEAAIIEKFKAEDPLFATNLSVAREKMEKLPSSQRTKEVYERAYNMAMGEAAAKGEYKKVYLAQGREQALKEYGESGGATVPSGNGEGRGGAGKDGKPDISRVTLTREERGMAQKMVEQGFVSSIDEYKMNLVLLDEGRAG